MVETIHCESLSPSVLLSFKSISEIIKFTVGRLGNIKALTYTVNTI